MPSVLIIAGLTLLGLGLRLFGGLDTILFTYDQARDLFMAEAVRNGDFKLVGPPTDLPGVFHGPLYYYFLAPFAAPEAAILAVIFLNLFSAVPLYFLAWDMFKSRFWATIAAALFLVSFEAVQYARWLSNPTLVIPAYIIYIWGLWKKNWLWVAVGLVLAIQFQLFMLYLVPVTILYALIFRFPLRSKTFGAALLIFGLGLSSFLLAEIKFHFQGVNGLINFFGHHSQSINFSSRFTNYLLSTAKVFFNLL